MGLCALRLYVAVVHTLGLSRPRHLLNGGVSVPLTRGRVADPSVTWRARITMRPALDVSFNAPPRTQMKRHQGDAK